MMVYKLTIPGRLDGLNDHIKAERINRYKGAQNKAENEAIVNVAIRQSLPGVHIKNQIDLVCKWYEKNKKRDPDNISSFGHKVILDALVRAEVLENDGWENIRSLKDEFHIDKVNPRIEVYLLEVGG